MQKLWYSQIDDVKKEDRVYFKKQVQSFSFLFDVSFKGDKAFIKYNDPYNPDINAVDLKGRAMSNLKKFLQEFRVYQFNQ